MKTVCRIFPFLLPILLLLGACQEKEPAVVIPEPTKPEPTEPEPQKTARPVHVTATSFSLGNGITDPYDSLFIHFDGKITDSTTPHYDWVTYFDYYHPQNRKILNDTTLVLVFDGHQANRFGEENEYGFKVTGEDGTQTDISVSIPFYRHLHVIEGSIHHMSLYNDNREILFVNGKKLVRMDYLTGQVIQEYDLSDLPGTYIGYSVNPFNGLIYLSGSESGYALHPEIHVLDPGSGEVRLALSVPEIPGWIYQYRQPIGLGFTKFGTGLLSVESTDTSGSYLMVIRTQEDGTLTMEWPYPYPEEADYWDAYGNYFTERIAPTATSQDGSYLVCAFRNAAYYILFDGEDCRLHLGYWTPYQKWGAKPSKKEDAWFMREHFNQFVLYADGSTSPQWDYEWRHEGGADFCYTPGYEHLVLIFDKIQFNEDPSHVSFIDTRTGQMVLHKLLPPGMDGFQTTPDGQYGILYFNTGSGMNRHGQGHVLIFVYDMPFLLSHCRI